MVIQESTPVNITAGDTVKWLRSEPEYLPADGWVLTAVFVSSAKKIEQVATDNGDGRHLFIIDAVKSATFTEPDFSWSIFAEKSGERHTLESGRLLVAVDLATQDSGHDPRSYAEKIVEAIDAAMANKATADQLSYSINGRSLSRIPPTELIELRKYYSAKVKQEKQAAARAKGKKVGQIRVRF